MQLLLLMPRTSSSLATHSSLTSIPTHSVPQSVLILSHRQKWLQGIIMSYCDQSQLQRLSSQVPKYIGKQEAYSSTISISSKQKFSSFSISRLACSKGSSKQKLGLAISSRDFQSTAHRTSSSFFYSTSSSIGTLVVTWYDIESSFSSEKSEAIADDSGTHSDSEWSTEPVGPTSSDLDCLMALECLMRWQMRSAQSGLQLPPRVRKWKRALLISNIGEQVLRERSIRAWLSWECSMQCCWQLQMSLQRKAGFIYSCRLRLEVGLPRCRLRARRAIRSCEKKWFLMSFSDLNRVCVYLSGNCLEIAIHRFPSSSWIRSNLPLSSTLHSCLLRRERVFVGRETLPREECRAVRGSLGRWSRVQGVGQSSRGSAASWRVRKSSIGWH